MANKATDSKDSKLAYILGSLYGDGHFGHKDGKAETKCAFIRGFFDAEGSVNLYLFKRSGGRIQTTRHVKCFSNDTELLKEAGLLLARNGKPLYGGLINDRENRKTAALA